jgi:hypothetical protein
MTMSVMEKKKKKERKKEKRKGKIKISFRPVMVNEGWEFGV